MFEVMDQSQKLAAEMELTNKLQYKKEQDRLKIGESEL